MTNETLKLIHSYDGVGFGAAADHQKMEKVSKGTSILMPTDDAAK